MFDGKSSIESIREQFVILFTRHDYLSLDAKYYSVEFFQLYLILVVKLDISKLRPIDSKMLDHDMKLYRLSFHNNQQLPVILLILITYQANQ